MICDGKPRELLKKGIANQYSIVISDLLLQELTTVLKRPKFKTSNEEINRIILALIQTADVIIVRTKIKVVKADTNDDMVLETANKTEKTQCCPVSNR